jgi:hypothetical protein
MGLIISELSQNHHTLLLFILSSNEQDLSPIKIIADYNITLIPFTALLTSEIDSHGNIWNLYSNGTYQMMVFEYISDKKARIKIKK